MTTWWEVVIGCLLLVHGLGHLVSLAVALGSPPIERSQVGTFARVIRYQSPLGKAWAVAWLAAAGLLLAAGVMLLGGQSWWRVLALSGLFVSFVAIVPGAELWNTTGPESGCFLIWPTLMTQMCQSVPPVARAGLLLDLALVAALLTVG